MIEKKVNRLHYFDIVDTGWIIRKNEEASLEEVPFDDVFWCVTALRKIIGNELHKFTFIPARAIMNKLYEINDVFREEQDEHNKMNAHLRNTGPYTKRYYNALHVLNHISLVEYYKVGKVKVYQRLLDITFDDLKKEKPDDSYNIENYL